MDVEKEQLFKEKGTPFAPQSKDEGMRLFEEACSLYEKAQTDVDLEEAVQKYQQALAIFQQLGFKYEIGVIAFNLGIARGKCGQYVKAVEYYEQALAISRELEDRKGEADALNKLGVVYEHWGQYDKAAVFFKAALVISRELKDREGEANALNCLGAVYEDWGQYDKAAEFYEQSLAIDRELKDRGGEASALNNLGIIFSHWGQYDKAAESYEKALTLAIALKDRKGQVNPLTTLGSVYMVQGQYDKAVEYCEKSLAIARELKYRKGEVSPLNNLGHIYRNLSQLEKAGEYYEESLTICRELKNRKEEGTSLANLGNIFYRLGQYDKASKYYEQSLTVCRGLKDHEGEGRALNGLGSVFRRWDQYDRASEYYEQSLAICRGLRDREGEGFALIGMGNVYYVLGQYDKAVDFYEKSLAVYRGLKDREGEELALNNLGSVFSDWGQYDKAVEFYENSIQITRDLKDRKGEGRTLVHIGRVFQRRGEHKKALEHFHEGLAIYIEVKVPTDWPKALIADTLMDTGDLARAEPLLEEADYNDRWGRFYLLKSDFPKAKEYYGKVLQWAEETRNAISLFTAYTGLGAACEGLNDNRGAAQYYEKAVKHTEEIRSSLFSVEREKFFDVTINGFSRITPYEGLARALMRLKGFREAFTSSDYTTNWMLSEAVTRLPTGKDPAVPPEIVTEDTFINNELTALKKGLKKAFEKKNKILIQALETQANQLERKFHAHVETLREKYPVFAATQYPQAVEISQTAVSGNDWVLSYDVTDLGLLVYLTKGESLIKALFKPVPGAEIGDLLRQFRESLETKKGRSIRDQLKTFDFASGKKLADILLSDILPLLPKDAPLTIIPGGFLRAVPFDMLVLNEGRKIEADQDTLQLSGAEFFGDRNPVSYHQSVMPLTLARTLGKHKKPPKKGL